MPKGKLYDITDEQLEVLGGIDSDAHVEIDMLEKEVEATKKSVSDGKKLVADAITQKGVATAADAAFQTMADNVKKIETGILTDDATAVASNILTGKTAYAKGAKITGTMANRGAVSQSLGINGSYTIPAGYHSGSGKVTQSVPTQGAQTITPGTANKTIAAGRYLSGTQTIKGDANLKAANIKKGVSIFGVSGSYEGGAGDAVLLGIIEDAAKSINNLSTSNGTQLYSGTVSAGSSHSEVLSAGVYSLSTTGDDFTISGSGLYKTVTALGTMNLTNFIVISSSVITFKNKDSSYSSNLKLWKLGETS